MVDKVITEVEFDYTSFLGASCNKKWTFLEALSSVAPVFGEAWKASTKDSSDVDSRLWDEALKTLSTRQSDELNLIRLIRLARQENIECLKVVMPYPLDDNQIDVIQNKSHVTIISDGTDDVIITVEQSL
ncbi:transporter [Vibrio sp. 10N.286.49.C2]|uniref:transporter n=1 Tax=unclassified Vibrio TaxID=2614977 RepID=UPI000C839A08|nr:MULTISPECIES: transporter [unclassified Vibrio]PMH31575.1 transporter [Vibrio sp. 10N.286.49.C2]PMH50597.1 transporter [Vibrio sp. 10N.286.49.B1]PMH82054.1 transporter [Vibrio sp. 10N.286.48.B7]